jgi:uncharacterized protein YjbI with pentapeptide repeats
VLTQFRLAVFAMATLAAAWAGQASAFWPFAPPPVRIEIAPAYGGVCEDCDLSGRLLAGAKMSNSVFNGSDFSGAVMTRVDASHSAFEAADFTDADLRRARLADAHCPRARFERATLINADASGADFTRASFAGADVTRMNFAGADLSGADLRGARGLTQAQLDLACGDTRTRLPRGLRVRRCNSSVAER